MVLLQNVQLLLMFSTIFGVLTLATLVTVIANLRTKVMTPLIANLNARMKAWWVMIALFAVAVATAGGAVSIAMFAVLSVFALREFVSLTQTREADHNTLVLAFFFVLPVNYLLIATHCYDLFLVYVPICAFIWLPIRRALAGDTTDFFARSAEIQWGLMICIYFTSYAAAALNLGITGDAGQSAQLLCFLVFVVQFSDVMQYVFGKLFGKHKILPAISPNKTVEGFIGGLLSAVLLGTCLSWLTPFQPWQAAVMALIIGLTGFGGGIVMSAIKRDRNLKDFSAVIPGHGGVMDRIDSLCFAAPVFFHLTRFLLAHN